MLYFKFELNWKCGCWSSKVKLHVTCHSPIGILYIGMTEKTRCFEILKQPYLCNHLTNLYRIKTKLYIKASSIIVCGKENEGNNLKFWCNNIMPTQWLACSHADK